MTPTEVTTILQQFNEWQRGDGPLDYVPSGLINAIDAAIEMIEQQERIFDVIERTWYKQGLDVRGASLSNFMAEVLYLAPAQKENDDVATD